MNDERRKRIKEVKRMLQDILSDEEMAFDNMPEGLQCSIRGEESEEAIDLLNEAIDTLDEIL